MKVLVTGANGFLATHIIMVLLEKGVSVRGLLRDKRKFLLPAHELLELMEGDITDPDCSERACADCTHVVHAAALTRQDIPEAAYWQVNIQGTWLIAQAAVRCGVERFIYISSANTIGYGTLEKPGNEQSTMKYPFTGSGYAKSKKRAEELLEAFAEKMTIVKIHPTFMLGAFDAGPGPGRILRMGFKKRIICHPPGGKNFIHVNDVALAVSQVLSLENPHEKYILANENLTYRQFFEKLAAIQGIKPLYLRIPKPALLVLGILGSLLRTCGIRSELSFVNMRILCLNGFYGHERAKADLSLHFRPAALAIREALGWSGKNKIKGLS